MPLTVWDVPSRSTFHETERSWRSLCEADLEDEGSLARSGVKRRLTGDDFQLYPLRVEIDSIRHKALRNFAVTGQAKGLPGNLVDRLRNMLAYLVTVETVEELKAPPNYGAHELTGNRNGTWSLTVTKNWRMTFRINAALAIEDLDLEDYH